MRTNQGNRTKNGRWGRYKTVNGVLYKRCTGQLHKEEGEWFTLDHFFIMKSGPRAGKPIPQCKACERTKRFGTVNRGLVPTTRVWFIFEELKNKLGKTEAARRVGISYNCWYRAEKRIYKNMWKSTVIAAIVVLREVRASGEVRHKDSIRHGALARGRQERPVMNRKDLYKPHGDADAQQKRRVRAA